MIFLVVFLTSASVVLLVMGVGAAVTGQGRVVRQRLTEVRTGGRVSKEAEARRRRAERRDRLQGFLESVGGRFTTEGRSARMGALARQLAEAGFRRPNVVTLYMGVRALSALAFLALGVFLSAFAPEAGLRFLLMVGFALLGWMLPFMIVKRRAAARRKALNRGLADALDLMVVCVEAGLGVNQALMRVAEEMDRVSPAISDELTIVTLEMRAGTPRDEALRNLAERTGNEDVRSWVNMMIQTEKFGTSIADSLRVHSDTLRTKRHQRAEEEAAKLTVKMLIPLVIFVFPAIFIVILGPAVITLREFFGSGAF
jgi:tight adherence protein C